jgi:hypothetical protein
MKLVTRRYARKQLAWIKNKLLPRCQLQLKSQDTHPVVIQIPVGNVSDTAFRAHILHPAIQFSRQFLRGHSLASEWQAFPHFRNVLDPLLPVTEKKYVGPSGCRANRLFF